ncbi:extracellular solute-binding protein [Streptomyces sp. NBC_01304]|uniref:extracellular solute-binding protein n=1 Tax=Streptomyces sp. NBC_01304 TaxID=2903818 RepID=UPI002E13E46D|nr:extracellular solute-binding protein [Streptomyces sp. NBC_01304]
MKQRFLAVCLALSSVAVLGGCGLLPGNADDSGQRTVTVWLMKDSASQGFIEKFSAWFEERHPEVDLDIRIQEWSGIGKKVSAALATPDPGVSEDPDAASDAPDVIEVGNTQVAQYVDQRGLADLSLESLRDFGMDDWVPGLAEPGSFNGKQFGIPWYAANRVVIYNKDLFTAAGIKRPPASYDEWLAYTRRLNSGGNQGIYLAGQDWYTLSGFIWEEGGELATEHSGVWKGSLDSPAALRAMDFYRRLQALGQGPEDADEETPPQAEVFAKGDVAQIVSVPGAARLIEEKNPDLKGKLGFFPVPGKRQGRPGAVFTGGSDLVVPERSDERDAAVDVVAALAGKKWQTELARSMNYVPNKTTLAGVVAGEPGVEAMAKGAARGRATPNSPRWAAVEEDNPIKAWMTEVLTGGDPARTAKTASRRITEALDLRKP